MKVLLSEPEAPITATLAMVTRLPARSSRSRRSWRSASASATSAFSTLAAAEASPARAFSIAAWKIRGSMVASSWPFFTLLLKSTSSRLTVPETCEPMLTVISAATSPVAETTSVTGPRLTGSTR